MPKVRREYPYPDGSVVVKVPRSMFPTVFTKNGDYEYDDEPYLRVKNYNLVIVPSGPMKSCLKSWDRENYCFVYSGKSNRVYPWDEFYPDSNQPTLDVGGPLCLVECQPAKDHLNPPLSVSVYASTAGVVWLALRALGDWAMYPTFVDRMTTIDDAPFSSYFDRLIECDLSGASEVVIRDRLNLFFGMTPTEEK